MSRIVNTLLFAISLTPLSGQIYAEKIQSITGDPVVLNDLDVDDRGKVYASVYEVFPNLPPGGYGGTPIINIRESDMKLDRTTQPLQNDSLSFIGHFLDVLDNGDFLYYFYSSGGFGNGRNNYQWSGYSYAILNAQLQPKIKLYDTLRTYNSFRNIQTLDSNKALGINFGSFLDDSLSYFNPTTGVKYWTIKGSDISSIWLVSNVLAKVNVFADSLRIFLRIADNHKFGYGGRPFKPYYVRSSPRHMITVDHTTGTVGQEKALPQDLISLKHLDSNNGYALLYLDSTGSILRYEARDSSWQVLNSQTINLQTSFPQYQISSVPRVLSGQNGIGFIARSTTPGPDSLYYLRLNPQGQLLQRERINSLPLDAAYNRSLTGPNGSYIAALNSVQGLFLFKAQPRNRISLPASEAISENLQVSPLPASERLQVKLPAATGGVSHTYRLYGLTGQMYQHGSLHFSGGEATLDINQLPSGSYILVLEAGERRYRAKVVVER